MLEELDAEEIRAWKDYERSEGPLNNHYEADMLAHIFEILQYMHRAAIRGEYKITSPPRPYYVPKPKVDPAEEARQKQAAVDALDKALGG